MFKSTGERLINHMVVTKVPNIDKASDSRTFKNEDRRFLVSIMIASGC